MTRERTKVSGVIPEREKLVLGVEGRITPIYLRCNQNGVNIILVLMLLTLNEGKPAIHFIIDQISSY